MMSVERRYSHHLAVLTPFPDRVKKLASDSLHLDILQTPHKSRWKASCTFVRLMAGSSGRMRLIMVHQPLRIASLMTAAVVLSARKWNGGCIRAPPSTPVRQPISSDTVSPGWTWGECDLCVKHDCATVLQGTQSNGSRCEREETR